MHSINTQCPHRELRLLRPAHQRISLRMPRPPARFRQARRHRSDVTPRAPFVILADTAPQHTMTMAVERWAAAASNSLPSPTSGLLRQQLFRLTPTEWMKVWKHLLRSERLPPRAIGLQFLDQVRKH